jgi:hypothetical protein
VFHLREAVEDLSLLAASGARRYGLTGKRNCAGRFQLRRIKEIQQASRTLEKSDFGLFYLENSGYPGANRFWRTVRRVQVRELINFPHLHLRNA